MKEINIISGFRRFNLYKQMFSFYEIERIYFYSTISRKNINNKRLTIIDCDFFLNEKYNFLDFITKNDGKLNIVIFFWNGDLDFQKYKNSIKSYKRKFNFIEFFFVCGSFESNKFQSRSITKKILENHIINQNKYDAYLSIRNIISKIKSQFVRNFNFKKIKKFQKFDGYVFIGKWKYNLKEILDFTDSYNVDRKQIEDIFNKIGYFDRNKKITLESLSNIKLTKYLSVNYFIYNSYARKKIVEALYEKKCLLLIDNYSHPDFLNQSYKTKAIFLDLGCKCGGSSFYPRHLALKLNYKNNYLSINYFKDRQPDENNFLKSIEYIDKNLLKFKLNNIFFNNNL